MSRALALPLRFAPGHFWWEGAEVGALMWVAWSLLPEDSWLTSELLPSQRLFLGLCLLAFLPGVLLVRLDQAKASCFPAKGVGMPRCRGSALQAHVKVHSGSI